MNDYVIFYSTNAQTGEVTETKHYLTDEEKERYLRQEQENINAEARAYLNSTDWYVVRFAETGVAIPQDILDARQAARDSIVEPAIESAVENTTDLEV